MEDINYWQSRSVLVTGGAGFIGSHLVEMLVAAGADVTVVDNDTSLRAHSNLDAVWDAVNVIHDDIRVWQTRGFDTIFHFAALAYVPPSVESPIEDFDVNCAATLTLLDQLRRHRWPGRLVFASSGAVYGNPTQLPVSESDATVPISPYGVAKLAAERYVAVYARLYRLQTASLRLFSAYGPRHRKQVVWDVMTKLADHSDRILLHGDGTQIRDFIYVRDAAAAAMHVAQHATMDGEIYNVAAGHAVTIDHVARVLCDAMNHHPCIDYTGVNRPGDPETLIVDNTRLTQLGWLADMNLIDGLCETAQWFQGTRCN